MQVHTILYDEITLLTSVPQKNIPGPVVYYYCGWYTFLRNRPYTYHFCNQAQIEHYANIYRPQWDCLSEQSSKLLLEKIEPRLVLSGHTHHGCKNLHTLPNGGKVPEWSVASFSWRNRNNPVIVLATLTQKEFVLNKCYLPQESTVINIYILGSFLIFLYAIANRRKIFRRF